MGVMFDPASARIIQEEMRRLRGQSRNDASSLLSPQNVPQKTLPVVYEVGTSSATASPKVISGTMGNVGDLLLVFAYAYSAVDPTTAWGCKWGSISMRGRTLYDSSYGLVLAFFALRVDQTTSTKNFTLTFNGPSLVGIVAFKVFNTPAVTGWRHNYTSGGDPNDLSGIMNTGVGNVIRCGAGVAPGNSRRSLVFPIIAAVIRAPGSPSTTDNVGYWASGWQPLGSATRYTTTNAHLYLGTSPVPVIKNNGYFAVLTGFVPERYAWAAYNIDLPNYGAQLT